MEWTIGNLTQELWQPSNPYANLVQHALLCCQLNSLKNIIPELEEPTGLPRNAMILVMGMSYSDAVIQQWDQFFMLKNLLLKLSSRHSPNFMRSAFILHSLQSDVLDFKLSSAIVNSLSSKRLQESRAIKEKAVELLVGYSVQRAN